MSPIHFPKHLPTSNIVQIFTEELPFMLCTGDEKMNAEKSSKSSYFCKASQAVFLQENDVIMNTGEKMPSVQIFECIGKKESDKKCETNTSADVKGWLEYIAYYLWMQLQ